MIEVKQAAEAAISYVQDLLGPLIDPRIEEAELSDDHWVITVGFLRPNNPAVVTQRWVAELDPKRASEYREYKQIAVRMADGTVDSMKIRKV